MYKVSILIPVYNVEKYLSKCLESILLQTYKNIEIIIINDGTTDSSLDIAELYASKYDFIHVYSYENAGISKTRNRALEKATGDYYLFVDSDDYIDKDMFKNLIEGAEKYKCEISMCDLVETYNPNEKAKRNPLNYIKMNKKQALEQLLYDKNIGNYVIDKLFSKTLFDNISFPIGKLYEDISTTYKLFIKANNYIYIPTTMYYYYQRSDSIVNNITRESILDYINAVFERYYDLKNNYNFSNLYTVYSLVNVVIKMSIWSIKIQDYELFDNTIYDYYCKLEKELYLVDEGNLIKIMTNLEKACFYLLKLDKQYLINFIENKLKQK